MIRKELPTITEFEEAADLVIWTEDPPQVLTEPHQSGALVSDICPKSRSIDFDRQTALIDSFICIPS